MICLLSFGVLMFALRSNGQTIMFYSCDLFIIYYLFTLFCSLIFKAEERRPVGPFQDVRMRYCSGVDLNHYLGFMHDAKNIQNH